MLMSKIGNNQTNAHKVAKMSASKSIKIAMVHVDINQKELAALSGVSETTISQTLSGKTSPNTRTLSRLARAMKMNYSELIKLGE